MSAERHPLSLAEAVALCPVSEVNFKPAWSDLRCTGIEGWCQFVVAPGLAIRNVALRRRRDDGSFYLAYPLDPKARDKRYIVQPINDRIREAIEVQVFHALRAMRENLPP